MTKISCPSVIGMICLTSGIQLMSTLGFLSNRLASSTNTKFAVTHSQNFKQKVPFTRFSKSQSFVNWRSDKELKSFGKKLTGYATGRSAAWQCGSDSNEGLVNNLAAGDIIKSEKVKQAMLSVDRGNYANSRAHAYEDRPLPIGFDATISAPHMHATALELLSDHITRPNSRVLDVGCGSGYLTTVIARMQLSNGGVTVGVDYLPGLVELARTNMMKEDQDLLEDKRVELVTCNGWEGYKSSAPYDAIHVGAAAASIPTKLVEQLKPNGRMVIPVGPQGSVQQLYQVELKKDGGYEATPLMLVNYVPLVQ